MSTSRTLVSLALGLVLAVGTGAVTPGAAMAPSEPAAQSTPAASEDDESPRSRETPPDPAPSAEPTADEPSSDTPSSAPSAPVRRATRTPSLAAQSEPCAAVGLSAWGAIVEDAVTAAEGSEGCLSFTTTSQGVYVVRLAGSGESRSGGLTLNLQDAAGSSVATWYQDLRSDTSQPVTLKPGATYRLLVTSSESGGGPLNVGVYRHAGDGCSSVTGLDWSSPSSTGSVADGAVACRTVGLRPGATVRLSIDGSSAATRAEVLNADGSSICVTGSRQQCTLYGSAPYRVLLSGPGAASDATYSLATTDTSRDTGCVAVAAASWGSTLPATGSRRADGDRGECFVVRTTTTGPHLFRMSKSSDAWGARVHVYESDGSPLTELSDYRYAGLGDVVTLKPDMAYRVSVEGDPDGNDPRYSFAFVNINDASGCVSRPSLAWNAGDVTGTVADGELDCVTLPASPGSTLRLAMPSTDSSERVRTTIFNSEGAALCTVASGQTEACSLSGSKPFRAVTGREAGGGSAAYSFGVVDASSSVGCTAVSLATWGGELPGAGSRPAEDGPADCFLVKTASAAGPYVLRTANETRSWRPQVELFESDGKNRTRPSVSSGEYVPLSLKAAHTYRVVVSGDPDGDTGAYRFGLFNLRSSASCPTLADLGWGAPTVSGRVAAGSATCRVVSATAGSSLRLRALDVPGEGRTATTIVANDGTVQCTVQPYYGVTSCPLTGSAPFRAITIPEDETATTTFDLRLTDGSSTAGCQEVDDRLGISSAPLSGTLAKAGDQACFSVAGTGLGKLLAAVRGTGVDASLLDHRGRTLCDLPRYQGRQVCDPGTQGRTKLVVDTGAADGAPFKAVMRRTGSSTGCTAIDSIAFTFASAPQRLRDELTTRCVTFTGAVDDDLVLAVKNASGNSTEPPSVDVFDSRGEQACAVSSGQETGCRLGRAGTHTAILMASDSTDGQFVLDGRCTNPACGTDEFAIGAVSPASAGQSESTTVTIQGKALDLSNEVRLVRSGASAIVGRPLDVSEDRRSMRVVFDLGGAPLGAWDVELSAGPDARVVKLKALTVVGARPPDVKAELVSLDRFVAGRTQTVSVTVENLGNVDALAVPVVLGGLPAGSVVEPQFALTKPAGEETVADTWDQEEMSFDNGDGTIGVPLIVGRIPGGQKTQYDFKVTVKKAADYNIRVANGDCLVAPSTGGARGVSARRAGTDFSSLDCAQGLMSAAVGEALDGLPGAACVSLAGDLAYSAAKVYSDEATVGDVVSPSSVIGAGLSTLDCVTDFIPAAKLGKFVTKGFKKFFADTNDNLGKVNLIKTCVDATGQVIRSVASLDPNEIVGPLGSGPKRAIGPDGTARYAIYFENVKTASAPAQTVTITDQLDPQVFDLSSVRFGAVQFGTTNVPAPQDAKDLDRVVDLPTDDPLQFRVQAGAASGGKLTWELSTVDPATGELPEDPFKGFLPPNVDGSEGQGVVYFDVKLKAGLANNTAVKNDARIVFDLNPPIDTNVWSNVVDVAPPTASLAALPARTTSTPFPVSWTASDGESGIRSVQVFVSKDGGAPTLWQTSTGSGSASYPGVVGSTYTFTVQARDHAGEVSAPAAPTSTRVLLRPTMTVKASAKRQVVTLLVTLKAAGRAYSTGTVSVKDGARTVAKKVKLKAGKAKVVVKKVKKGKRTFAVTYGGSGQVAPTTVKATVRVR